MNRNTTENILNETENGYNLIAEKFSQTRSRFWAGLEFIKDYVKPGDRVLDYGCGNGRLLELIGDISEIEYAGIDPSEKLIDLAKKRYPGRQFTKLNLGQETIPFADNFFNAIFAVAVFHHIPSRELRKKIVSELFRTATGDGYVVVTMWNLWRKRYVKNVFRNWIKKSFFQSKLDWNDCYISFSDNKGNTFQRYHHAYTVGEVRKLFESVGFKTKRCEVIDGKNIVYIGKKEKQG